MPDPSQLIANLDDVRDCAVFAQNAIKQGRHDLAALARKRAIQIRAAEHGANSEVERECIEAVLAYEDARSHINGKRTTASRTWPMIGRHGVIEAVERVVKRPTDAAGYTALVDMGLQDYSFEAVVLRHPTHFSQDAIEKSRERLKALS